MQIINLTPDIPVGRFSGLSPRRAQAEPSGRWNRRIGAQHNKRVGWTTVHSLRRRFAQLKGPIHERIRIMRNERLSGIEQLKDLTVHNIIRNHTWVDVDYVYIAPPRGKWLKGKSWTPAMHEKLDPKRKSQTRESRYRPRQARNGRFTRESAVMR